MTTRLFIYGTLKQGQSRHGLLAGQKLLGKALTGPFYRMYNVGSYPALIPAKDGRPIEGELWLVNDECLAELDRVEGVSEGLYERASVRLSLPTHETVETYFYLRSVEGLQDCGGCW